MRDLRTAAGTWGGRNGGRRFDLVILPGILDVLLPSVAVGWIGIERFMLALVAVDGGEL
jgi:hypothetical protein